MLTVKKEKLPSIKGWYFQAFRFYHKMAYHKSNFFFEMLAPASSSRFESLIWALTALCEAKRWLATIQYKYRQKIYFPYTLLLTKVGFIYTFWYSLSSTSSIL